MVSKYQKKKIKALQARARVLHKKGLPLRAIGRMLGRSYQWVANAIKNKKR